MLNFKCPHEWECYVRVWALMKPVSLRLRRPSCAAFRDWGLSHEPVCRSVDRCLPAEVWIEINKFDWVREVVLTWWCSLVWRMLCRWRFVLCEYQNYNLVVQKQLQWDMGCFRLNVMRVIRLNHKQSQMTKNLTEHFLFYSILNVQELSS